MMSLSCGDSDTAFGGRGEEAATKVMQKTRNELTYVGAGVLARESG